jgi:hypothetical protein
MRGRNGPDHEWQERTRKIRGAARKGEGASEIAATFQLPVEAVKRVLAPAEHPRLSDPVDLIRTGRAVTGKAPAAVQLYWFGFLTAAGQIIGQGSSLTLVVTLRTERRESIERLAADLLMTGHLRCELCHSSIVGWQGYLRDPVLCKALVPWGIPSSVDGDDPTVLDDLPAEFVTPFLRGYVDGERISNAHRRRDRGFTLRGAPAILAGINAIIQRYWNVSGGMIISGPHGGELRFADPAASRAINHHLDSVASRFGIEGSPDAWSPPASVT